MTKIKIINVKDSKIIVRHPRSLPQNELSSLRFAVQALVEGKAKAMTIPDEVEIIVISDNAEIEIEESEDG